mgnify:CR=1 FL=1
MQAENLSDLLHRGLEYAWDCERHLLKELPKMEKAASSNELKAQLLQMVRTCGGHSGRLNDIFVKLDRSPDAEPHEPIRIITAESDKMMKHIERGPLLDAALIMYANQICHYEIALYGTICAFARTLDLNEIASLLDLSLNDEKEADRELTHLAEHSVNRHAARFQNAPGFIIM